MEENKDVYELYMLDENDYPLYHSAHDSKMEAFEMGDRVMNAHGFRFDGFETGVNVHPDGTEVLETDLEFDGKRVCFIRAGGLHYIALKYELGYLTKPISDELYESAYNEYKK